MPANDYFLSKGVHDSPADGRCAMEWVAYLANEKHSDAPVCVDQPLRHFCIQLNDVLDDERRQRLRPLLARTIGTAGDGQRTIRSRLAWEWICHVYVPAWLDLAALNADGLRKTDPHGSGIGDTLVAARDAVRDAVRDAAWAAAWAAAGDTAWDAVRDAAGDAAWDAAWDAARAAAGDAAWAAAWNAARAAVRDAAWAATWDAARAAVRDAAGAAVGDAVRAAVREFLRPTVATLQDSAIDLLDRMLPLEPIQMPTTDDHKAILALSAA